MKAQSHKIRIEKVEFTLSVNDRLYRVRWRLLGIKLMNAIGCKEWELKVIVNDDNSGVLNKVYDTFYHTTLQPNYTNTIGYFKKIFPQG
jgi:hypothetical protein